MRMGGVEFRCCLRPKAASTASVPPDAAAPPPVARVPPPAAAAAAPPPAAAAKPPAARPPAVASAAFPFALRPQVAPALAVPGTTVVGLLPGTTVMGAAVPKRAGPLAAAPKVPGAPPAKAGAQAIKVKVVLRPMLTNIVCNPETTGHLSFESSMISIMCVALVSKHSGSSFLVG
jgi:hypothetical protein